MLTFDLIRNIQIDLGNIQHALLNTQIRLRLSILNHVHAEGDVVQEADDPYTSDTKSAAAGCFVAIGHSPDYKPKRLTYGMVSLVLKGLFDVLYIERQNVAADVMVAHDTIGVVGYAAVIRDLSRHPTSLAAES